MEDDADRKKTENPQNDRSWSSAKLESECLKLDRAICNLQKGYDAKRCDRREWRADHRGIMLVEQDTQPRIGCSLAPDCLKD